MFYSSFLSIHTFEFDAGTYKKSGNYDLDQYYKDCYGKEEYLNSKFTGKFTNNDGTVYMYQPVKDTVIFVVETENDSVSCDGEVSGNKVTCKIFDTKYSLEVNDDKLEYVISGDKSYTGTFTKNPLTKKDIIAYFDVYANLN